MPVPIFPNHDTAENNRAHAKRAEKTIKAMPDYFWTNSMEDNTISLLANLLHYCFRQRLDWKKISKSANNHFNREINGE